MKSTKITSYLIFILLLSITNSLIFAQSSDEKPVIRYSISETINLTDVIAERVYSRLEEMGYEVEITSYTAAELSIESIVIGQADIIETTSRPAWLAMAQDIPFVMVLETTPADWVIAGSTDIQSCEDWDEAILAHHSETSLSLAVGNYYTENFCPDTHPEIVYIRGSANRAAALLGGAIDLTIVKIEAILPLLEEAPDEIHIVVNLIQELPWLVGSGIHVSDDFLENHPNVVQDIVTTYIEVYREIKEDPEGIVDEIVDQMELDPEEATAIIQAYIDNGLLDENGGLTEDRVAQSLEFLIGAGFLPEELTMEDVVDMTFIGNALEELDSE
jgi:NitT/TauT family transport system substrate-binding protein